MLTFYQWLQRQIEREDVVGDFAHVVRRFGEPQAPTKKKTSPHMVWSSWLIEQNPSWEVINAFNTAWREYQQEAVPSN